MTSNPAAELVKIFSGWNVPPGNSAAQIRGLEQNDVGSWKMQIHAVQLLADIRQSLAGMDADGIDVTMYLERFVPWCQAVFSYQYGFAAGISSGEPLITGHDLQILRALSTAFQLSQLSDPNVTQDDITRISHALEAVTDLVRESSTLRDGERRYLLGLIAEAVDVLDELQLYGTVTLRHVTFELSAALNITAEQQPASDREKWRSAAKDLLIYYVLPTASAITASPVTHMLLPRGGN